MLSVSYWFGKFKQRLKKVLRIAIDRRKKVVIGRVACLGKELFRKYKKGEKENLLINQQKMRVDQWMRLVNGAPLCRPEIIKKYLAREDVLMLLEEQSLQLWKSTKSVAYILMDSYSELTDQLFVHRKDKWAFCCNYSDLLHSPGFNDEFECRGHLPIEMLECSYRDFFDWIKDFYPDVIVFFVDFPTALDDREIFNKRGAEITRVINLLAKEYDFLRILSITRSDVTHAEDDEFPYHFGALTYQRFLDNWGRIHGS